MLALVGGLIISGLTGDIQAAQVVPFEYRDGLIWVKVSTLAGEGREPARLHFLLDSGAATSVLNLDTARRLGVPLGRREKVRLVGASASAYRVKDFKAQVAGIAVSETPLALDLSETSALCSRYIDGLLGEDFFRGRIVEIDYRALCIRVLDKADASGVCAVMPMKSQRGVMLVPLSVNGSVLRWTRLDTGCDAGLHWVAEARSGDVRTSLQMGRERLTNVKTTLHRLPLFPAEAGLLGNEVLSNYRVTFDGVNGRLLLARV